MNTNNFIKFLGFTITSEKLDWLLGQIKDMDNLTARDIKLISDTCNRDYESIMDMYLNGYKRLHNTKFIKEAITNKDIDALRRVILEGHILVANDKIYLRPIANKLKGLELDQEVYQELLELLISSNEICLASKLSNGNNYYRGYNNDTPNIENYLVGHIYPEQEYQPAAWLDLIYDDLKPELKAIVHAKLMEMYDRSYNRYLELKDKGECDQITNGLVICIHDEDKTYHEEFINIPTVYKHFSAEEQNKINKLFDIEE